MRKNRLSMLSLLATMLLLLSSCAAAGKDIKLFDKYAYSTFDKQMSVYYNVLPTRILFVMKNISSVNMKEVVATVECRTKTGYITNDYPLGRLKQYHSKEFEAKLLYSSCDKIKISYSYAAEDIPEYVYNKNDKGRFQPLPYVYHKHGEIEIKR